MQYPIDRNEKGEKIEEKVNKWYSPKNLIKGIVYSVIIGTAAVSCADTDNEDYVKRLKKISENSNTKIYTNKEIKESFGPNISKKDSTLLDKLSKTKHDKQ